MRNAYIILVEITEEHVRNLGIDGRMILKSILQNSVKMWTGFNWLRIGSLPNTVMELQVS
jgi:hypothetical protein